MNIRVAPNGFSGYGPSAGMGGLHPTFITRPDLQPVPSWAFGGGGGISSATSQAGFPGPLPIAWTPQVAAEDLARIPV
jgi:hypothetical protein